MDFVFVSGVQTLAPIPQSPLLSQSPPPPAVQRLGLVDENGVMSNDFEVGEFDPDVMENWNNETEVSECDNEQINVNVRVWKFGMCPTNMRHEGVYTLIGQWGCHQ
ncbi:hypothetical protein L2E82_02381 [Cichorium intybus]|uniref:Uncharacterized protein n=1 Tax=Cichorium intybus TaxID=13427 RepID=A0ACB9H2T1_CICIN|nr:hypothetical protein L2E82_02381 [Cichorium intybus]